jgi:hypothetical protein
MARSLAMALVRLALAAAMIVYVTAFSGDSWRWA